MTKWHKQLQWDVRYDHQVQPLPPPRELSGRNAKLSGIPVWPKSSGGRFIGLAVFQEAMKCFWRYWCVFPALFPFSMDPNWHSERNILHSTGRFVWWQAVHKACWDEIHRKFQAFRTTFAVFWLSPRSDVWFFLPLKTAMAAVIFPRIFCTEGEPTTAFSFGFYFVFLELSLAISRFTKL